MSIRGARQGALWLSRECRRRCSSIVRAAKSPARWVRPNGMTRKWLSGSSGRCMDNRPATEIAIDERAVGHRSLDELWRGRRLLPVALRVAARPRLRLLCRGRHAHRIGRADRKTRSLASQPVLCTRLLDRVRHPGGERDLACGTAVIVLGLFMMGLARLPWLQREFRLHHNLGGGRPLAAYVIGLAFAFGWTPCIGPVLGAILTTSAVSATVPQGLLLLSFYSLGLGLPFLAAALFTDHLISRLRVLRRLGRLAQLGAGAVVTVMGVAMVTGELTSFSYWLLDSFPVLARFG